MQFWLVIWCIFHATFQSRMFSIKSPIAFGPSEIAIYEFLGIQTDHTPSDLCTGCRIHLLRMKYERHPSRSSAPICDRFASPRTTNAPPIQEREGGAWHCGI
ncbi:hypothetical protein EV426DRAFT_580685, partial [Tirmania nivea]